MMMKSKVSVIGAASGVGSPAAAGKTLKVSDVKALPDQLTEEGATYLFAKDIDLGGETVVVPNGCVLKFDGGKVKNGTLVLDDTQIDASPNAFIFDNVKVEGVGSECYVDWFGATCQKHFSGRTDSTEAIQKAVDSAFKVVRFNVGYYYVTDSVVITKARSLELAGGYTPAVVPYRANYNIADTNVDTEAQGTVVFSDKDKDIIVSKIQMLNDSNGSYNTNMLVINGGTFDVSLAEGFNHAVIKICRIKGVNLFPEIRTSIIGPNWLRGKYTLRCRENGVGVLMCTDPDATTQNGAIYGGHIWSLIERFHTGVKHDIPEGQWLTNIDYNCSIDGCKYAYDFGTVGNNSGCVDGWIQCTKMFEEDEDGYVILGGTTGLSVSAMVWDMSPNTYTGLHAAKYIFERQDEGLNICGKTKRMIKRLKDYEGYIRKSTVPSLVVPDQFYRYNTELPFFPLISNVLYGQPCDIESSGVTFNSTDQYLFSTTYLTIKKIDDENSWARITLNYVTDTYFTSYKLFLTQLQSATTDDALMKNYYFKDIKVSLYYNDQLQNDYFIKQDENEGGNRTESIHSIRTVETRCNKIVVELTNPGIFGTVNGSNHVGGRISIQGQSYEANYRHIFNQNANFTRNFSINGHRLMNDGSNWYLGYNTYEDKESGYCKLCPNVGMTYLVSQITGHNRAYPNGTGAVLNANNRVMPMTFYRDGNNSKRAYEPRGHYVQDEEFTKDSGTTAQRPKLSSVWVGFMYFDTTLDIPIWKNSKGVWVDASGNAV